MMKYFSMFSGIGGFEKGIEQSGVDMECVGYSEIDKYAVSIYERQFPNHINWGDATEIDPTKLPDFDFLVGGFPCQAFSLAGCRRGFDDTRGTLFFEIARILREKKPRYFLLENVKGLLSHNKGETFKTMLGILAELGYDVEWEVLNSKNFGVPQNRERIFLKGYFRRKCGEEIFSQKRNCREIDEKLIKLNDKSQGHSTNYKHPLKIKTNVKKGYVEANSGDGVRLCHPSSKTSRGRVQKECVGALSQSTDWGTVDKDYRIRRLTPTECERIQGFPDGWTEYGKDGELISDTQRYKCLGNAVTVNVIEYLIRSMFS